MSSSAGSSLWATPSPPTNYPQPATQSHAHPTHVLAPPPRRAAAPAREKAAESLAMLDEWEQQGLLDTSPLSEDECSSSSSSSTTTTSSNSDDKAQDGTDSDSDTSESSRRASKHRVAYQSPPRATRFGPRQPTPSSSSVEGTFTSPTAAATPDTQAWSSLTLAEQVERLLAQSVDDKELAAGLHGVLQGYHARLAPVKPHCLSNPASKQQAASAPTSSTRMQARSSSVNEGLCLPAPSSSKATPSATKRSLVVRLPLRSKAGQRRQDGSASTRPSSSDRPESRAKRQRGGD